MATLVAVCALCLLLSLAPYWAGYHRLWADDDSWVHLKKVEDLLRLGPVEVFRVLYVRDLSRNDHWLHPGMPPLLHIIAVEGAYVVGLEWAMRLAPVLVLVLTTLWLYRLARAWSLAPPDAVLAAGLSSLSIEMVRQVGLRFLPQGLGILVSLGLLRSSYLLAQPGARRAPRMVEVALWTALIPVSYGSNLFHTGGVIAIALVVQWLATHRQRSVLSFFPVPLSMAAGVVLSLPFTLNVSYHPPHLYEYFVPIAPVGRLVQPADAAKYPLLIGPILLLLAAAGLARIVAACKAREPWAIWLASWVLFLAPQTIVWIFTVPGPPFRLLVMLIPALAVCAGVGFHQIAQRFDLAPRSASLARVAIVLLSAGLTAAFLARVELPRRHFFDGEAEMLSRVAVLPSGSAVFVTPNGMFWYFGRDRLKELSVHDIAELKDVDARLPQGSYWAISYREWTGDPALHSLYEAVLHDGRTVFDQKGCRIVVLGRELLWTHSPGSAGPAEGLQP